jgi:hypothetical protein
MSRAGPIFGRERVLPLPGETFVVNKVDKLGVQAARESLAIDVAELKWHAYCDLRSP